MIHTYIFDFDGTIADTLQLALNVFNELSPAYNFALVTDEHVAVLRNEGSRSFLMGLGIKPELIGEVIEKVKQKEAESIAAQNFFVGMPEALKSLKDKGFKLGILTNNSVSNVEAFLNKNNINVFDFTVSQSDFFAKDVLLTKILTERSLLPAETAYVGDEDRDIAAAKKAGLKSIAVTWGFNSETLLQKFDPDYLISTPEELLTLI